MCPAVRSILRRARPALAGGLVPLLLGAAGGDGTPDRHWAMDPAGPNAGHIFHLWWIFFWVCAVIFVLVIAFTLAGVFRTRLLAPPAELEAAAADAGRAPRDAADERRLRRGARLGRPPVRADDRRLGDRPLDPFDGLEGPGPADRQGHRPPVVVGTAVPRSRAPGSERPGHRRQRDPHPDRPAGQVRAELGGRDPQLLAAEPHRQEGPRSRPPDQHVAPGRPARHLRRAVRRVLRLPARPHAAAA